MSDLFPVRYNQEPTVEQLKRIKMVDPTAEITVPPSAEFSNALDNIFGLPQDGSWTVEKFQKAEVKI